MSRRTYVSDDDSQKVFIDQDVFKVNDTTTEIVFRWYRQDSILFHKSIERFYASDRYELVKLINFELDSLNRPIQIEGKISEKSDFQLNDEPVNYEIIYNFQTDTSLTMTVRGRFTYTRDHKTFRNSLCNDCLEIESLDTIHLVYSDLRQDTALLFNTIKIFDYKKGLISFTQGSGIDRVSFTLKE